MSKVAIGSSVSRIMRIKGVTESQAKSAQEVWLRGAGAREARENVARILGLYGVEYLGRIKGTDIDVHYGNAGDTYAMTAIFQGTVMTVGAWGDLIESGKIDEGRGYEV